MSKVQQKQNSENRTTMTNAPIATGTLDAALTAGNLLVAAVGYFLDGDTGARTVTLTGAGSQSWNAETVITDGAGNYIHAFYAENISGGSTGQLQANFSGTDTGTVEFPAIELREYSVIKTSSARLNFVSNVQTTPTTATDAVTSTALGVLAAQPAWIVAGTYNAAGAATPAAGTGFTAGSAGWDFAGAAPSCLRPEDKRVTATTSVSATFTAGNNSTHITWAWAFQESTTGTIITPNTGSLSTSGNAPVVTKQDKITPVLAALALVGFAPVLFNVGSLVPAAGALSLSGQQAQVTEQVTIRPNTGALGLAGIQPNVGSPGFITPGTGTLTLVGFAAPQTLTVDSPGVGALSLTGFAPSVLVQRLVSPNVGALSLAGAAPLVMQTNIITPNTGSLTINGVAAAASSQNFARPGAGALTFAGNTPSILGISTITPNTGALSTAGIQPNITTLLSPVIVPGTGAIAFDGLQPIGLGGGGGGGGSTGTSSSGTSGAAISGAGISGPGISA